MNENNNNKLSSDTFDYNDNFLEFVQEFPYQDNKAQKNEQEYIEGVKNTWNNIAYFKKNITAYQQAYENKKSSSPVDALVLYFIFYYGLTGKRDVKKAIKYLAAQKNFFPAIMEKAKLYRYGFAGFKKDLNEMFRLYQLVANLGDDGAKLKLAECYEIGTGTECNTEKAREIYKEIYEKTNNAVFKANAAFALFLRYKEGENEAIQKEWLDCAAEANEPIALFHRAEFYRKGENGYSLNLSEAFTNYQAAEASGSVEAALWLGECYLNGNEDLHVLKDTKEAKRLLEVVFNSDETTPESKLKAAFMLYYIASFFSDEPENREKYFSLMVNHDPAKAYYEQARIYHKGTPFIKKDYKEAFKNYEFSVLHGNWSAKLEVAYFYQTGRAGIVDQEEATKLLNEIYSNKKLGLKCRAQAAFYLYVHYVKSSKSSEVHFSETCLEFAAQNEHPEAKNYWRVVEEQRKKKKQESEGVAKQEVEIDALKEQLSKFQSTMQPILDKYQDEQNKLKAIDKINQNELMKIFYLHVQQLLNTEYMAAMLQGDLQRTANSEDLVAKGISIAGAMTPVPLLGGLFNLISALIVKHSDHKEEVKAQAITSNAPSASQFEVIAESIARKLTNIFSLIVECLPEESIVKLAKHLVQSMLEFIFNKEINTRNGIIEELIKAALKPRQRGILSKLLPNYELKTNELGITWKSHEIVCKAGWIKIEDGRPLFHHDDNRNPWRYGFLVVIPLPGIELPRGPWKEHSPKTKWEEQVKKLLASYNVIYYHEKEQKRNIPQVMPVPVEVENPQLHRLEKAIAEQAKQIQSLEGENGMLWTRVRALEQTLGSTVQVSQTGVFSRSKGERARLLGQDQESKTCCSIM